MIQRPSGRFVTFDRWDVVRVAYPFIEGDQTKHRPGLVVSTDTFHRRHQACYVAMITTAKAGLKPDDILITDNENAGLPEPCVIRVSCLVTLTTSQMSRRVGTIPAKDRNAAAVLLKKFIS